MSAAAWGFLGTAVLTWGGIVGVWIQARSAANLSRPTSNGFARMVTDALDRIEAKLDHHIADHASAQIHHGKARISWKDSPPH
jgi:glycogen debranching enzyme